MISNAPSATRRVDEKAVQLQPSMTPTTARRPVTMGVTPYSGSAINAFDAAHAAAAALNLGASVFAAAASDGGSDEAPFPWPRASRRRRAAATPADSGGAAPLSSSSDVGSAFVSHSLEAVAVRIRAVGLLREQHRFKSARACVSGRDLVDWLISSGQVATRGQGVRLSRALVAFGFLAHVGAAGSGAEFEDRDAPWLYTVAVPPPQLMTSTGAAAPVGALMSGVASGATTAVTALGARQSQAVQPGSATVTSAGRITRDDGGGRGATFASASAQFGRSPLSGAAPSSAASASPSQSSRAVSDGFSVPAQAAADSAASQQAGAGDVAAAPVARAVRFTALKPTDAALVASGQDLGTEGSADDHIVPLLPSKRRVIPALQTPANTDRVSTPASGSAAAAMRSPLLPFSARQLQRQGSGTPTSTGATTPGTAATASPRVPAHVEVAARMAAESAQHADSLSQPTQADDEAGAAAVLVGATAASSGFESPSLGTAPSAAVKGDDKKRRADAGNARASTTRATAAAELPEGTWTSAIKTTGKAVTAAAIDSSARQTALRDGAAASPSAAADDAMAARRDVLVVPEQLDRSETEDVAAPHRRRTIAPSPDEDEDGEYGGLQLAAATALAEEGAQARGTVSAAPADAPGLSRESPPKTQQEQSQRPQQLPQLVARSGVLNPSVGAAPTADRQHTVTSRSPVVSSSRVGSTATTAGAAALRLTSPSQQQAAVTTQPSPAGTPLARPLRAPPPPGVAPSPAAVSASTLALNLADSAAAITAAQTATRRAELEATVWLSGWLVKQGHAFRNWRRRWFVLSGYELRYYKAPPPTSGPAPPPQRTVDIRDYDLQQATLPRTPPLLRLLPRPSAAAGSVTFLMHADLGAPHSADYAAWMDALRRAISAWDEVERRSGGRDRE